MELRTPRKAPCLPLPLIVLALMVFRAVALSPNQTSPRAPAIIVFGDSIVDPGNNNAISTLIKCNFPPYGRDFVGQKATGRFSNGRIPSDIIASQMGIKELVPPFLGAKLDAQDLLTGVSFASGGSGYDPLTSRLVSAISMTDQLKLFKDYKEKLKEIAGDNRAADIISRSLYVVVTGTDDLANTYFTTPIRRAQYDLPSYIKFVVQCASSFVQELHNEGARKINVVGVPPIGCVPSQRTLAGGINRDCVLLYNQAASALNGELSTEIQRLNNTLQDARIVYIDIYTPLLDMILRALTYGFEESARGCCGTGTVEVTLTCNNLTTSTCEDVSKYVFWDSYHPTERAYVILMNQVVQQYGQYMN